MKPAAACWLLLLVAPMAFGSFGGGGGKRVIPGWKEEVRLRTGETVTLDRTGKSIAFKWGGRTIRATSDDAAGWPYVIDIYDGVPVLVTALNGAEACMKHGYPEDSLLAWRYEGRKWVRMPAAPAGVLVNLRKGYPERENEVVTVNWKEQNEGRGAGGPYGLPLTAHTAKFSEGCGRLPDAPRRKAETQALAAPVVRAEDAAAVVVAERVSFATAPEEVSGKDARDAMGTWIDNVPLWMARKCANVTRGFKLVHRNYPGLGPGADEVTINLMARVADPRIVVRGKPAYVFCDERTIVVFRHGVAERMLVTRFDRSGTLLDAFRVQLPGVGEVSANPKVPPTVWNVRLAGSQLTLTLADYAYRDSETQGGTLRRKAVYEASLGGP